MNLSAPFIVRPVATTLLSLAIVLVGAVAVVFARGAPAASGYADDFRIGQSGDAIRARLGKYFRRNGNDLAQFARLDSHHLAV